MVLGHLNSSHWVHQNAGITSYILLETENISILTPFANTTPRLQWSLLKSLGILCMETNLAESQHCLLVPLITNLLLHPLNKIKKQALSCLSLYCTSILSNKTDENIITPYLDNILNAVYNILGINLLLASALSTLSLVIICAGEFFLPYCDKFCPGLRCILNSSCYTVADQGIRAECIRTLGCIIEIMPSSADVKTILNEILNIKKSIQEEDQTMAAIWDVIPQFAESLKSEFSSYLNELMPELLFKANLEIDIHISEVDQPMAGYHHIALTIPGFGERIIAANTTKLQAKIKSIETIYNLVSSLNTYFFAWVPQTLTTVLPLIDFPFNSTIRKNSLKTTSRLPFSSEYEDLLIPITNKLIEMLKKHTKSKALDVYKYCKYLYKLFDSLSNVCIIGLANAHILSTVLVDVLKNILSRKSNRKNKLNGMDSLLYQKEITNMQEDDEIDDEIMKLIMETVGVLLRSFKTSFSSVFLSCFKNLYGEIFYKSFACESEILNALCLFCDYIEYTGDALIQDFRCPLLDEFIKYSYHQNPLIRQTSAYGIGLCAQKVPELFNNYLASAIEALKFVITLKNPSIEAVLSAESAAGALGKIAILYRSDLIPVWLSCLPLKTDVKEAKEAHSLFLNNLAKLSGHEQQVLEKINELKYIGSDYLDESCIKVLNNMV